MRIGILRTVLLSLAFLAIVVASGMPLVSVEGDGGGNTPDWHPYGVLSDPAHPVSFLVYASIVLTVAAGAVTWVRPGRGVADRAAGAVPAALAVLVLVLAAAWLGAQESFMTWSGWDEVNDREIGGMTVMRPTRWVALLWFAIACHAAAGLLALIPRGPRPSTPSQGIPR
ncbi:hypothetical protein ACFQS2_06880 [Brachybacterium sp. GCM10030267]|uniref:hypothetical protein n=1 Tax=unclassified Brachybacterium TaxID=2623841 RepID=UPI003622A26C